MIELFESNLTFIVLAIIIGVRVVMYLRRRAAEKQARERNPPPLSGIGAIEAEGAAALRAEDDDEGFSAWALAVDREPAPPPVRPKAVTRLVSASEVWPQTLHPPVADIGTPVRVIETVPVREDAPIAGTSRHSEAAAFWGKLKTLPPLRQGIILSEILGPPKGF